MVILSKQTDRCVHIIWSDKLLLNKKYGARSCLSTLGPTITSKCWDIHITETVLCLMNNVSYISDGQETLGLLVSRNMVINAILLSNRRELSTYDPLDGKDLTRPNDIAAAVIQLNSYLHNAASQEMNDEIKISF